MMKNLVNEALQITEELGDVIFVGALAAYMHTKIGRDSQDIDFVVESEISDEHLLGLQYHKSITGKQPWFTSRGFKIDIFTGDLPGVSHEDIISHAKIFPVGNKGKIRVLGLECLIAAKFEANREQDSEDLTNIAQRCFRDIDWNLLQSITDEFTTNQIRTDMTFLARS